MNPMLRSARRHSRPCCAPSRAHLFLCRRHDAPPASRPLVDAVAGGGWARALHRATGPPARDVKARAAHARGRRDRRVRHHTAPRAQGARGGVNTRRGPTSASERRRPVDRTPSNRPAAEASRARQRRPRAPARRPSSSPQHRPTPTRFRVQRRRRRRRRLVRAPRARAARGRPARRPAATLVHDCVLALHLRAQAAQQPTSESTTPPPLPAAPLRVCPQPNG